MLSEAATDGESGLRTMHRRLRVSAVLLLLGSTLLAGAQTKGDESSAIAAPAAVDRGYFNQDLFVPKGQMVHNATCVFCSVQVEGDVTGRVVVLFGNLSVNGEIKGTTLVVGGNAVFDGQARVLQSTVVLFGNLVYETEEVLTGSAYVLGGHSSSYAARSSLRRRLALSPRLVTTLALLLFLLLLVAAYGVRQRRDEM